MSKHGTTSEGWNENYSSPDPEHARGQTTTSESTARFRKLIRENPDQSCKDGFPPETGLDTRQPEMVSREKVLDLIRRYCQLLSLSSHARSVLEGLEREVRKL